MLWTDTDSDLQSAADAIRDGKLVAIPTETVYGLGANALDATAVASIFEAKGRPADNPLIVHISDPSELETFAYPDRRAYLLAERFWPGPLTMILPKKDVVPSIVTAGLDSVAIRLPSHPIARELIRRSGCPVAAPSANVSGKPSGTTAQHVLHDFDTKIAGVVDGGPCACGLESTVVSLLTQPPVLLRPGYVTPEQLRTVLPDLVVAKAVEAELEADEKVLSPGLAHRHYAPSSDAVGLIGSAPSASKYVKNTRPSEPIAVMCFSGEERYFDAETVIAYGKRGDAEEQGAHLFEVLRKLDEERFSRIYVCVEHTDGVGLAVYNRLLRSCGFEMIKV